MITVKCSATQLVIKEEKDEIVRWFVQLLGKYELIFKKGWKDLDS